MTDAAGAPSSTDIVARADFQYRWRVYVFFILVFGYGLWSLRDGFFHWPRDNAEWQAMIDRGEKPPQSRHNEAGILINQVLGIVLPVVSLTTFVWLMYRSRGEYRLTSTTLGAPGHPPIPLDAIQSLDKSRWDRKGVATVEYRLSGGREGKIDLRDMVYHRRETDLIVQTIGEHLDPTSAQSDAPVSG